MRRPVPVRAPLFAFPTIVGIYSCLDETAPLAIHRPDDHGFQLVGESFLLRGMRMRRRTGL